MEIDNKLIASIVTALAIGGAGSGLVGFNKNSQLEEKKDLKFASFEELCKDQLAACESRYTISQENLAACWAAK